MANTLEDISEALLASSIELEHVEVAQKQPRRARPGRYRDPETGLMVPRRKHYSLRLYPEEMDWLRTQATLRPQNPKRGATNSKRSPSRVPIVALRALEVSRLLLAIGLGEWRLPWPRLEVPLGVGVKSEVVSVTIDNEEWDLLVRRACRWRPYDPDPVQFCLEATLGRTRDADEDEIPVLLTSDEYAALEDARAAVLLAHRCHPMPPLTPALEEAWEAILQRFEAFGAVPAALDIAELVSSRTKTLQWDLEQGLPYAEADDRWADILKNMKRMGVIDE